MLLFVIPVTGTADSDGFIIDRATLIEHNRAYRLDADIQLEFSELVIDALKNGVPLKIDVRAELVKYRPYFWNQTKAEITLSYSIRYHALAKLYQIIDHTLDEQHNFATLDSAIESMETIRGALIVSSDVIAPDTAYRVRLKVELDFEALPLALRPVAYLSPEWYLDSDWYAWSLER